MSLEKLKAPPIAEVVCGFAFEPVSGLDPIVLGTYWEQRKETYPGRQIHPALADSPSISIGGTGPLRVWLIGADDAFVLQIQPDRFYFNWRKRDSRYPRFSDRGSEQPGLLTHALEELERFRSFCEHTLGMTPEVQKIELTKIDHLIEKEHWHDLADLAQLVPWLEPFVRFSETQDPSLTLRFKEIRRRGLLLVLVDTSTRAQQEEPRIVRIESRIWNVQAQDLREDFAWANEQLNDVFAAMIPESERTRRFG